MTQNLIIFGTGKIADIAFYYMKKSSLYNVIGFSLQKNFMNNKTTFNNLPIFEFETIQDKISPKETLLFAPCDASRLNKYRESIYHDGKKKGYKFASYISPHAIINSDSIGENNFIFELNNIQPYTKIGNNCILWSGNHIGHHTTIGDNVFIASHVVISGNCNIGNNSYLGVNSTLKDSLTIKNHSIIGMGSVVTKDTEEYGIYIGNPAKLIKKASEDTRL